MKSITLLSGSIFAGNPIILRVTPSSVSGSKIAFHRIVLDVYASLVINNAGVGTPVKIPMSVSLYNEDPQDIDISSALRSVLDAYEYTPSPTIYPIVKWRVEGYDEYMDDGVLHPRYELKPYPIPVSGIIKSDHLYCISGSIPETQRVLLPVLPSVSKLSDKPASVQLFPIDNDFVHTPSYTQGIDLIHSYNLANPVSILRRITSQGQQNVGGNIVYALPDTERTVFRFINRYGVLETISVPRDNETTVACEVHKYASGQPETFNSVRHGIVRKSNDRETLTFTTDPLSEDWLFWYIHEFFMAEHVWMAHPSSPSTFIRCHIVPDDSIKAVKRNSSELLALTFTAKLDINGHIL